MIVETSLTDQLLERGIKFDDRGMSSLSDYTLVNDLSGFGYAQPKRLGASVTVRSYSLGPNADLERD
jgi:hypothetical protein